MDMQDKEFDQLFSRKFENFEEEPSPMVWNNIAGELAGKKPSRSVLPWLSIAATVLIVATAGVFFIRKGEQSGTPKKANKLVVSGIKPAPITKHEVGAVDTAVTAQPTSVAKLTKVVAPIGAVHHTNNLLTSKKLALPVSVTAADVLDHEPLINSQPIIATLTNPASTKIQATLPDVQLAPRVWDTQDREEKTVTASADKQAVEPVKKHGIRSFGGLINAVVAKIDKRDDKLIEFSDGDGDDDNSTTVTGVNLGLIKIKKQ